MTQHVSGYPFSDLALSRRLERGEGRFNASFVQARACAEPGVGAEWMEVAGAWCMFDGPGSPLTQTFGLGLFDAVADGEMERIEQSFASRGAEVFHQVSPVADPGLMAVLGARRRGAQLALLRARLRYAAGAGLPAGHDGRAAGKRITAQRRAPGIPHPLHADQVAPRDREHLNPPCAAGPAAHRMCTVRLPHPSVREPDPCP